LARRRRRAPGRPQGRPAPASRERQQPAEDRWAQTARRWGRYTSRISARSGRLFAELQRGAGRAGALLRERAAELYAAAPSHAAELQALACAAGCVFGGMLGLLLLVREVAYHVTPATRAVGFAIAAACVGFAVGLWLPQALLARSLPHRARDRWTRLAGRLAPALGDAGTAERAALASGALCVVLGIGWLLLLAGSGWLENLRAFLTAHFLFPPALIQAVLWVPTYAGLVLAGGMSAVALTAVFGWWRRAVSTEGTGKLRLPMAPSFRDTAPSDRAVRRPTFWIVAVGAIGLAGLVGTSGQLGGLHEAVALLALFLAAVAAVIRRSPEPRSVSPIAVAEGPPPVVDLPALMIVAVATLIAGVTLLQCQSRGMLLASRLPWHALVMATAAFVGLVLHGLRRSAASGAMSLVALLLAANVWVMPFGAFASAETSALLRLWFATALAAVCLATAAARIAGPGGSARGVLAWVGSAGAVGSGLATIGGPIWEQRLPSAPLPALATLCAVATAVLLAVVDRRLPTRARVATLAIAGLSLMLLPLAGPPAAGEEGRTAMNQPAAEHVALREAARGLLAASRERIAWLKLNDDSAVDPGAFWHLDLRGRFWDVVVLTSPDSSASPPDRASTRRLLARCLRGLRHGGRLAVELPADSLRPALAETVAAAPECSEWSGYRLRVESKSGGADPASCAEILIFGRDVPAWLGGQTPPEDVEIALYPLDRVAPASSPGRTDGTGY